MRPDRCFVAEDAPAGVEAARVGGMASLGVARLDDAADLGAARADLVVATLDEVDLGALSDGRLRPTRAMTVSRTLGQALEPTADPAWVLDQQGFDLLRDGSRESRFSISNGFLGVRGGRTIDRLSHSAAALGGVWMTAVLGFAGLVVEEDGIRLDPNLPVDWSSLTFAMQWRGRHLSIGIDRIGPTISATLRSGDPMTVTIGADRHRLDRKAPLLARVDALITPSAPMAGSSGRTEAA